MRDLYTVHTRSYRFLRWLFLPLICRVFNFESAPLPDDVQTPFLLISNHTTDLDPVLVGACTQRHMYFVASEHVLRGGAGAWLLRKLFAPVPRLKGATDAAAAMAILRRLRGGANVCLFAEGNRSFNGLTGPVFAATGKLVKAAGCTLLTYRIEGGYLTSPRWSVSLRRGEMRGYPVRTFTPAQLKSMDAEEINRAIAEDIFEDAYARERTEQIEFRGRRLAEKLETALFLCPRCKATGKLHSRGDELECECGLRVQYGLKGELHGDIPFESVTEWDAWQRETLPSLLGRGGRLWADEVRLLPLSGREKAKKGTLYAEDDSLVLDDLRMPVRGISDMAIAGRGRIKLTFEGEHYEIRGAKDFCARKYLLFYQQKRSE